jgi:hypothetical protein
MHFQSLKEVIQYQSGLIKKCIELNEASLDVFLGAGEVMLSMSVWNLACVDFRKRRHSMVQHDTTKHGRFLAGSLKGKRLTKRLTRSALLEIGMGPETT